MWYLISPNKENYNDNGILMNLFFLVCRLDEFRMNWLIEKKKTITNYSSLNKNHDSVCLWQWMPMKTIHYFIIMPNKD